MNSEIGKDIPVLVALVRAQERLKSIDAASSVDLEKVSARLHSEDGRQLARALLGQEIEDPTLQAKADDVRKLALGR